MVKVDRELTRADVESLPRFRKRGSREYSAACPFCGEGDDRFRFWPDKGNYWCRVCDTKGFITESDRLTFTPEQYEAWKRAEAERERQERLSKLSNLERLALLNPAGKYHRQMIDRSYWYSEGFTDETINRFKLGCCPACPLYRQSPSWTIPVTYRGRLFNIRHRLANPPDPGDKYRPEMPDLLPVLFNADALLNPNQWFTVLAEGEKKPMILEQYGFPAVGIPGNRTFQEKWAKLFTRGVIYIALDPDSDEWALRIGKLLTPIAKEVRICKLPVKPDDFFVKYGGTPVELFRFLTLGKKLKG